MGKKTKPEPVPYERLADKDFANSKETANLQTQENRPDVYTPWGSSTWTNDGQGAWENTVNLTPEEQQSLEAQQRIGRGRSELAEGSMTRAEDALAKPFDWEGLPDRGAVPGVPTYGENLTPMGSTPEVGDYQSELDFSSTQRLDSSGGYDPRFAQASFDRNYSLLGPTMQKATASQDSMLRNQGLRPGTEAYDAAVKNMREQQGESINRLANDSVLRGLDEQDRQFGRELDTRKQQSDEVSRGGEFSNKTESQNVADALMASEFDNKSRAQLAVEDLSYGGQEFDQGMQASTYQDTQRNAAIAEEAQRRGMSINEMNALLNGQQINMPGMPNFMGASRAAESQFLQGGLGNGQIEAQNYGTGMGAFNNLVSSLAGAGSAYKGFSGGG